MGLQGAPLIICSLLLVVITPSSLGKHKSGGCPAELDVNGSPHGFSCSNSSSFNFTVKTNESQEGIFFKFNSINLLKDDVLSLYKNVSDKSIFSLTGPSNKEFSFYVSGDVVTVKVAVTPGLKADRVVKGIVYTGCQENVTVADGTYELFSYENVDKITTCSIIINSPGKEKYLAAVTLQNVTLQGNSSLKSDGLVINYDSKTMSAAPFEVIAEHVDLALQLDQSINDQVVKLLLDRVNKGCSGMLKIDSHDKKKKLALPEKPEELYSHEVDCRWVFEAGKDSVLGLTVSEFDLQRSSDFFVVADGASRDSPPLVQAFQADGDRAKGLVIRSSGQYLWVALSLSEFIATDKFSAVVDMYGEGGHLFNNGSVSINSDEVAYFLEAEPGHQVLLSEPSSFPKSGHVLVYSDFCRTSPLLEDLTSASPKRPVVSTGNRMLLLSSGFKGSGSFRANFTSIKPGCHGITLDTHGFYTLSGNCNTSCSWLVRPPQTASKGKLLVSLSHLNFGPGASLSLNTLDMKPLLKANCSSSAVPPIEVNASQGLYLSVNRGTCSEADANSTALSGSVSAVSEETAVPELQPHVGYSLRSPRYPNQYPLNANQSWLFKTNSLGGFHLTFNSFDVKAGHELILSNGKDRVILNGSALPKDLLIDPMLKAEFQSPAAGGMHSGYGFDAVLTPCDKVQDIAIDSGRVETPSYPAPVKNNSLFYWSITIPQTKEGTSASVRFNISYNLTTPPQNISDFLVIYDGDSVRSPRITNFTSDLHISRTRSLLIKYQSSKNETAGVPVRIAFDSQPCNETDMCHNTGYCIHKEWRCNGVNDCGDNTDELNCGDVPPPPVPPAPTTPAPSPSPHKGGGVSPAAFAVTVIIALLVGIAGTLLAPVLVRRYRAYRYSRFSSVSVTE